MGIGNTILAARRVEKLTETVEEIGRRGGEAKAAPLDQSDLASLENFIAVEGPFDIVLNAAGLARQTPIGCQVVFTSWVSRTR